MSEAYGKFQLIKKLATGGMAQIYLARHAGIEGFERLCVVKRILPHLAENQDFVRMFLDEAKIAARLNHPNIVQIYDLGALDESFFIAMEFIHGEDLRRIWKRADQSGKEMPIAFVLRVIADACAGLDYAHKKTENGRPLNIVHRDISPQNVLVSFDGGVKVVDFGIAKAADKMTETRSGVLKGKYSYMSPEQALGRRDVDARTDIFALGVVLYELLTGTRLFKRGSDMATLQAVMECAVSPPSQVNTRVPEDLDPIVMRALSRAPGDRFQQAVELQLALEGWLMTHQLPASSANVAAYMRELYGDRLAAEQQAGTPLPDGGDSRSNEEELAPRRRGSTSRPRGTGPSGVRAADNTAAMRPSRPSGHVPRPASGPGRSPPPVPMPVPASELPPETSPYQTDVSQYRPFVSRRSLAVVFGVALLAGIAAVALWSLRPVPDAVTSPDLVRVDSSPPRPKPETPVEQAPARIEPPAPAKAVARVAVRSEPVGAQLFVGREPRGTTPAELELAVGESVDLRVELAGYETLVRTVQVGDSPAPEIFSLQRRRGARTERPSRDVGASTPPGETEPPRAMGMVRFAITPMGTYANVRCGRFELGQVPGMGDQQIPAGTYDCTFTNPELGTRSQRVEIRPNALAKVPVKFDQD